MKPHLLLLVCLLLAGCDRPHTDRREIDVAVARAANDPNPGDTVSKLFASMHQADYRENGFPALGWSHIPALLERAPSRAKLKAFPVNPASSRMQAECSEGILALWLIEGIRQGGKYPSLNPICRGAREEDSQQRAVQAYLRWWQKVKDDPNAAAKRGPFADTELSWY
jgi:hypothetical protein